jgi:transposase-like protein
MAEKQKQEKSPMQKYTIKDFQRDFPNDVACLEWLKEYRWPDGIHCEKCDKVTKHHQMTKRRSYSCQECGNHVHPTAGTIFHKSTTALTTWFYAVYLMAQTRTGISAKQIERETGVTYKTAWRMFRLIRSRLDEDNDPFSGNVEVDETYFGGKAENMHKDKKEGMKRGRGSQNKTPIVGMVERKGRIRAIVVPNVKAETLIPLIEDTIEPLSRVHTDEFNVYDTLEASGYQHEQISHSAKVYVIGDVHTQTIDGFWSLIKRGIGGVYHQVSPNYLQHYVNEYAFRYNHRNDVTPMFRTFLRRVGVGLDD